MTRKEATNCLNVLVVTSVKPKNVGNQSLLKNIKPFAHKHLATICGLGYEKWHTEQIESAFPNSNVFTIKLRFPENDKAEANTVKGPNLDITSLSYNDSIAINNDKAQWKKSLPSAILYLILVTTRLAWGRFVNKEHYDLIIGYENTGILASWCLKRIFPAAKLIKYYQGTALGSYFKMEMIPIRSAIKQMPLDYFSWKVPSDGVIITDDGTNGVWVAKQFGYEEEQILSMHNAMGSDLLSAKNSREACTKKPQFGARTKKKKIVMAQRAVPWKRIDRLVKLISKMQQLYPDLPSKLIVNVFTSGPNVMDLKKASEDRGLQNVIKWFEYRPHSEVMAAMMDSDAVISTSDVSNLSNSILEGLALGLDIVSIDDGSLDTLIERYSLEKNVILLDKSNLTRAAKRFLSYVIRSRSCMLPSDIMSQEEKDYLVMGWLNSIVMLPPNDTRRK